MEAANNKWVPVCNDDLRKRLQSSMDETVLALCNIPFEMHNLDTHIGFALMHAYLSRTQHESRHLTEARRHLDAAVEAIAETEFPAALYSGYVGVAWTVEHLKSLLYPNQMEDLNEAVDEEIVRLLLLPWGIVGFDLINGLAGIAVYAFERMPRSEARRMLELILRHFHIRAERDDTGSRWLTVPTLLPSYQRETAPQGYYNLGLAHGMPCVVATLGRLAGAAIGEPLSRELLNDSVKWLLMQRDGSSLDGYYAHWTGPGVQRPRARAAWCYGDPGVATALLWAARCAHEKVWEDVAIEIFHAVARRPVEYMGVIDTGLCHGSAGLAHLFNRAYQATRVPEFAQASCNWLERMLAMRRPGEGIAGYCSWSQDTMTSAPYWKPETDLLNGAAGIVLTYLAATTTTEPSWDQLLLAATPPMAESGR